MKVLIFFLSFFSIFCFVLSAPTQSADCTNDDEICQNYFETQILPILIRVFICVFIFFVIFIFSIIIFCFLCHTLDPVQQNTCYLSVTVSRLLFTHSSICNLYCLPSDRVVCCCCFWEKLIAVTCQ